MNLWLLVEAVHAGFIDQSDSGSQRNLYWDAAVSELLYKLLQPAPPNIKPCNYKHDSRKCTDAGINSRMTVPSKVHASQNPTKKSQAHSKLNISSAAQNFSNIFDFDLKIKKVVKENMRKD